MMTPFLNHKYFELITMEGRAFGVLSDVWTDDEHLQFRIDTLAYYEFVAEFLTTNNRAMARAIDLEPRHIEYLTKAIEWQKESIKHDAFNRKARAYVKQKKAKETADFPPEPLPDDTPKIAFPITAETLLSLKYN